MSIVDSLIARSLPYLPRSLVWRVGSRYVAGEDAEAALDVVTRLVNEGCSATLDLLGEDVEGEEQAPQATEEYCCLLDDLDRSDVEAGSVAPEFPSSSRSSACVSPKSSR